MLLLAKSVRSTFNDMHFFGAGKRVKKKLLMPRRGAVIIFSPNEKRRHSELIRPGKHIILQTVFHVRPFQPSCAPGSGLTFFNTPASFLPFGGNFFMFFGFHA